MSRDTTNEIYPQHSTIICQVLTAMKNVPLISAANSRRGTQFKMNFTVEGNKNIIFKPAWYPRNEVIEGEVYSGKDRHSSEILSFYLGALLNFRWTSVVIGRAINLKEVFYIADKELQETIISKSIKLTSFNSLNILNLICRKWIEIMCLWKMFLL